MFNIPFAIFCVIVVVWIGLFLRQLTMNNGTYRSVVSGIILLLLFFAPVYLIGGGYLLAKREGALIGALLLIPAYFISRLQIRMVNRKIRQLLLVRKEICEKEIAEAMALFCDKLRCIAGNESVLLFVPDVMPPDTSLFLQNVEDALKDAIVMKKVIPLPDESAEFSSVDVAGINAEIENARSCGAIVFFDIPYRKKITEDLKALDILKNNSPESTPLVIIFRRISYAGSQEKVSTADIDKRYFQQLIDNGKAAYIVLLLENTVLLEGAWCPQAVKVLSFEKSIHTAQLNIRAN